jgi:hypothetical protein
VIDLYEFMFKQRLTTSRRHCSTHWCQMAPNYLAIGGPSYTALINVFRRLVSEGRWATAFRVAHMILFDQVQR